MNTSHEDMVVNKIPTILAVLLLTLPAWSMSPVTDTDLSSVSSPSSLIIGPAKTSDTGMEQEIPVESKTDADDLYNIEKLKVDPNRDKDISKEIVAEDNNDPEDIGIPSPSKTYSMEYPDGQSNSSNDTYKYIIRTGDVEMRDTFINQRNSTIAPGSWVDIKTR